MDLEAAAIADFVVALYNPRSQKRVEHLVKAREIFLKHRSGDTPVAIARSVYRDDEQITLTTLDKMLEVPVDMLTTVAIGNKSTAVYENWMMEDAVLNHFAKHYQSNESLPNSLKKKKDLDLIK